MDKPVRNAGCPLGSVCQKEDEKEIVRCPWYVKVRGECPNTGESIDRYECAIAWIPTLIIENSLQQRQTGAAVESFRNEMVKSQNNFNQLLSFSVKKSLPK